MAIERPAIDQAVTEREKYLVLFEVLMELERFFDQNDLPDEMAERDAFAHRALNQFRVFRKAESLRTGKWIGELP